MAADLHARTGDANPVGVMDHAGGKPQDPELDLIQYGEVSLCQARSRGR